MVGKIIVLRWDRLGARLQQIIAGLRLQQEFGVDLSVLWPVGTLSKELENPASLFGHEFVSQNFVLDPDVFEPAKSRAVPYSQFQTRTALQDHLQGGGDVMLGGINSDFALPGEDTELARAAFIAAARTLPLHSDISEQLAAFADFAAKQPVNALHVRRGDIISGTRWSQNFWPTKYVPDEYYDLVIETQPEAPYLLFSDTAETIRRFQDTHGIPHADKILQFDQASGAQRDLCELLAISRCERVICGSDSAFSTAAAMLGGTRKIVLPDDMPKAMRETADARLLRRVRAGPKSFINDYDFGQCAHRAYKLLDLRGDRAGAGRILDLVDDCPVWMAHLSKYRLRKAALTDDDAAMVAILTSKQKKLGVNNAHLRLTAKLQSLSMDHHYATNAFLGLGNSAAAVLTLSTAVLLQRKATSVDVMAAHLSDRLQTGAAGCPPTTCVPYGADQSDPGDCFGYPLLHRHLMRRQRPATAVPNWQGAMMLDWRDLSLTGGFAPPRAMLDAIVQAGQTGGPQEQSLAALAHLQAANSAEADRLIASALSLEQSVSGVAAALLYKRSAQICLARNALEDAETWMRKALDCSDHPAFACWWAIAEARTGRRKSARKRLRRQQQQPAYVLAQLLKLGGGRGATAKSVMTQALDRALLLPESSGLAHTDGAGSADILRQVSSVT